MDGPLVLLVAGLLFPPSMGSSANGGNTGRYDSSETSLFDL